MDTQVTKDYVEVTLTGNPSNSATAYKNHNSVLENLYTGTIVDIQDFVVDGYTSADIVGKTIIFAKVFKIVVSASETKYYVHKNAIVALVK
jgi:hypothetical protein